jgi:hypothetical protein
MWLSVAMHLGPLHAADAYTLTALALAPFVVVAVIIALVSRRDRRAERDKAARSHQVPRG